jgi:S-adenosylmethionine/arginine decarboxylase-like enzyme
MKITKNKLKIKDIEFLNKTETVYSVDFRAISENMDYEIDAMWKYENLSPWIVKNRYVTVNEVYEDINYLNENKYIVLNKGTNSKVSVYKRLENQLPKGVKNLWVAIPHPDADVFAENHRFNINYKYEDFIKLNNKISQKELFGELTPNWKILEDTKDLEKLGSKYKDGFIKREEGSGGYTVFKVKDIDEDENFKSLLNSGRWYVEQRAKGVPHSIQCVKNGEDVTIFGYTEQIIEDDKYFYGSDIKNLEDLPNRTEQELNRVLKQLEPLIDDYDGFFGIDFFQDDDESISILEVNVRLTAASIPTLLNNETGDGGSIYREDVPQADVLDDDIILTIDTCDNLVDTLKLKPVESTLGKYTYIELGGCKNLEKTVNNVSLTKIRQIVDDFVSKTVEESYHNFWPFGWTINFILEDSHVSLSSWYLEKKVTIDVFSCGDFDPEVFRDKIFKYFNADNIAKFQIERR